MQTEPQGEGFSRFLARFISRHPEWYGQFESARAKESLEGLVAKEEAHSEEETTSGGPGDSGRADGDIWAEEVRDEEAETEEAEALLSD